MASVGGPPLAAPPPPVAPLGWKTTWSEQHNQWYYVDVATGISQWECPKTPADTSHPAAGPPLTNQYSGHSNFGPQVSTSIGADTQQETSRGLGSMAAGVFLGHEMHEHHHSHHSGHKVLGTMATMLGSAGVGALGAKLFSGRKQSQPAYNSSTNTHPPYQNFQPSPPPASYYPAHSPQPAFHTGQPMPPNPGYYAAGAGAAVGAASVMVGNGPSYNYQHQYQPPSANPNVGAASGMAYAYGKAPISGPRLIIHAAVFADRDITERVRMMVNTEQQLSIQKKLIEEFGDPWPEAERKGLSILYQYGDRPMEVWAGSTENDAVTIKNEALSNERMSFVNKKPGRIISLIWGQESVLSDVRIEKLETEGELDCKDLNNGGWWAWEPRTLICYYRGAQGNIEIGRAREGGTLRLPWNPLSKYS